jgi:Peptidase family M23
MRVYLIILILLSHVAIPGVLLFWLFRTASQSRALFLSIALLFAVYLYVFWNTGLAWSSVGPFWPWLFWAGFGLILFYRLRKGLPRAWFPPLKSQAAFLLAVNLLLAGWFGQSIPSILRAGSFEGQALELEFPLTGGTFLVLNGGGSAAVNGHAVVKAQKYALDIGRVNALGFRADGILPENPDDYNIFGTTVVAPCSGEVLQTRSDLANQKAMVMDPENLLGNHVILYCGDFSILLAHLKQGSVKVAAGERVTAGQPVGQAGNTGNTSEPHLHIHAVKGRHTAKEEIAFTGEPVPLAFHGRFLIRNQTYKN